MRKKFLKRKKYQNPFLPKRSQDEVAKRKKRKRIFILFVFIILVAGLIYLFIYSPVFKINKIVVGETRDSELVNQLQMISRQEIEGYKYLIFPKDNILLLNKEKLEEIIDLRLALDELKIDKKLLHTLKVDALEKIPALLWQEGEEYYYIDKYGMVMGAVRWEEVEMDLPLINRGTSTLVGLNQKIIEMEDIDFIRAVVDKMEKKFKDWGVARVEARRVKNDEIYFHTSQGWYFVLKIESEVDRYLDYLDKLLKGNIEDKSKLEYIDLRIEDKIFYKEKGDN